MKQLLTILLLVNMLMLQYSKQVAYLQCKVSNALSSNHCDCEKIMAENSDKDLHDEPMTTASKNYMPDEFFLYSPGSVDKISLTILPGKPTIFIKNLLPQNFAKELIKPPMA
ncbi:MAG: hypothetical protein H7Y86_03455 [Rhizobacter sp.]|nr:hypothetical protein [Ferruginibacter sp.]